MIRRKIGGHLRQFYSDVVQYWNNLIENGLKRSVYLTVFSGGKRSPPRGLPDSFYRGFRGCIEYVTIDDEPLDMVNNRKNHGSIEPCDAA